MKSESYILRAIVGPTASGKTNLALNLARSLPKVVLINADAFAVYRGMEIGTATPTESDLIGVDFRLLSFVTPTEDYSIGDYQNICKSTVLEVLRSNKLPILVGGSALYVLSVLNDMNIPKSYPFIRKMLEIQLNNLGETYLYCQLLRLDPEAAKKIHPSNFRRLIRALEVTIGSNRKFSEYGPGVSKFTDDRSHDKILVLDPQGSDIAENIKRRLDKQIELGFIDEVKKLVAQYPRLSRTAIKAIGYREIMDMMKGDYNLEETKELIVQRTVKFSKRQNKWWKRDPRTIFVDPNKCSVQDIKLLLKL